MKKFFKVVGIIIGVLYALVAIILTVCLLNYNDYNVTEINGNSLVIVSDDELRPDFNKGDLVVVYKNKFNDIKIGEKIFFYDTYKDEIRINLGSVINKKYVNKDETTFVMDGEYSLSGEYVIGKANTSKVYPKLGTVLSILESRFGFLFIIIFPILILFIYEIYAFIKELKRPENEI